MKNSCEVNYPTLIKEPDNYNYKLGLDIFYGSFNVMYNINLEYLFNN